MLSVWALQQLSLNEGSNNVSTDRECPPINLLPAPKINVPQKLFYDVSLEPQFPSPTYNGPITRSATLYPGKALTEVCGARPVLRFPCDGDSLSSLEKADPWDGFGNDILPPKRQGRFLRNLRHQIFSLYRRLFGIVFAVNFSIFIAIACHGGASAQRLGLIVVANLSSSIFMRQDYVINAFFILFCAVPLSYVGDPLIPVLILMRANRWPLHIRKMCARVYHIGGCESTVASLRKESH